MMYATIADDRGNEISRRDVERRIVDVDSGGSGHGAERANLVGAALLDVNVRTARGRRIAGSLR